MIIDTQPQPNELVKLEGAERTDAELTSVRLFLTWVYDCESAPGAVTMDKADSVKNFAPIPGDLAKQFAWNGGPTLTTTSIKLAVQLARDFMRDGFVDLERIADARRISDNDMTKLESFLTFLESRKLICDHRYCIPPMLRPIISAHCAIGIIGRWMMDVTIRGRALAELKDAPERHDPLLTLKPLCRRLQYPQS